MIYDFLNELADKVHQDAHDKGWYDKPMTEDEYIEKSCNNLHDEVSELHEAYRNNEFRNLCDKAEKMREVGIEPLTCVEEELADIIIRALDNAKFYGINIGEAVRRKADFNKYRPYRNGGKKT